MNPGAPSETVEWSEILDLNPEVLIVAPCGYGLNKAVRNFEEIAGRVGFFEMAAVKNDRYYVMDGDSYVNRPGVRLVDTLEFFAQIIHPGVFGEVPGSVACTPVEIR
ncbi:MAG: ABC transporter substrate-binding protein [Halobacteria archaeon]